MGKEKIQKEDRSLTVAEKQAISEMKNRRPSNQDIFCTIKSDVESTPKVEPVYLKGLSYEDAKIEFQSRVFAATGSASQRVGLDLLSRACEALTRSSDTIEDSIDHLNAVAKAMVALQPKDEIEGQLISQLVVLHEQCMIWLGKAMRTDRVNFANTYLNSASKLLARHHETLESLLKYRRGGEQRVHVEHVHVHDGGKAIVGNVGSGGGLNQKTEEGPHAKV